MIGLIYSDYKDQAMQDRFHCLACESFEQLSADYPEEIMSLVDPAVDSNSLINIFDSCDFIFYWGHGEIVDNEPFLVGSKTDCLVSIRDFQWKQPKMLYLDACSTGKMLSSNDFPESLIIAPSGLTDYATSVSMGCSLISHIFDLGMPFDQAFYGAKSKADSQGQYQLIGKGIPEKVLVSTKARARIVNVFENLLGAWMNVNSINK